MIRRNRHHLLKFLIPTILFGAFIIFSTDVQAQACITERPPGATGHPNSAGGPGTLTGATGRFGAQRPGRFHKGFDLYHDEPNSSTKVGGPLVAPSINGTPCSPVRPPAGSNVNSNPAPRCNAPTTVPGSQYVWNTDPNGYGYYLVFDCQNATGKNIRMRYSHVAGYNEATNTVATGRTASCNTNGHVHLEMEIDDVLIDPECVWGTGGQGNGVNMQNNRCPFNRPADMCNDGDLAALKQDCIRKMDSGNCRSRIPGTGTATPVGSSTNEIPVTTSQTSTQQPTDNVADEVGSPNVDYSQPIEYQPPFQGDPATSIDTDGDRITDTPGIDTDGDGYADTPVTPGEPPVAPTPGQPGGDPDLVITIPTYDGVEFKNGCATDTWTAMVNQAVIEARREDILNKRFIVKPDSVLDYGCFDENLKTAQANLGPIFSETPNWAAKNVNILPEQVTIKRYHQSGLKNALASVVEQAAQSYYNQQFNQAPLAGSTPVGGITGGKNCGLMGKVWSAAKCKNFDDVRVFYSFEDLKDFEPREYPANMNCGG